MAAQKVRLPDELLDERRRSGVVADRCGRRMSPVPL